MRKISQIVLAIVCSLMSLTTAYGSSEDVIQKHANWVVEKTEVKYKFAYDIVKYVFQTCEHPELIIPIMIEESNCDPKASRKDTGVYGIGQISWRVWKNELRQFKIYRPQDLHDWRKNILAMNHIIEKYREQSKGDIRKTIVRYVGGAKKSNSKYRYQVYKKYLTLNKLKGGKRRFEEVNQTREG